MKNFLILLFICSCFGLLSAQNQIDTVYNWKLKFSNLGGIPIQSPQGNWIAVRKLYRQKSDTIYVINTQNQKLPFKKLQCSAIPIFIGDNGILGVNGNRAEFINLSTNKKYVYTNILAAYALEKSERFALYTKDGHLQIFDITGQKLNEIGGISGPILTDSKNTLIFRRYFSDRWEVMKIEGEKTNLIYSTINPIKKIAFTSSMKEVLITETVSQKGNTSLLVFGSYNSDKELLKLIIPEKSEVRFAEIQGGQAYLVSVKEKFSEQKNPLVETWYGCDPFVNENQRVFVNNRFWVWQVKKNTLKELKTTSLNNEIEPLNTIRYFLSFIPRKNYNYLTSEADLNGAQVFDLKTNTVTDLGDLKKVKLLKKGGRVEHLNNELVCSPDGNWFLASEDGTQWSLYKSSGQKVSVIKQSGLEQPYFSTKSDRIYFESSNDLWSYDIQHKLISPLGVGKNKMTRIRNAIIKRNGNSPAIVSYLPSEQILVENYDKTENATSYVVFSKGRSQTPIPSTKNRIKTLMFDQQLKQFFTLEENYNLPPALYGYSINRSKKLIYNGHLKDKSAKNIKQDIINYTALHKELSGILYYPTNFDPNKKYPMVVHIYEVQKSYSNEYLSPNNEIPTGFQIRTLLERGYFVFLPDIIFAQEGTGLSALQCVDKSLNEVLKKQYIDSSRIGLVGHSHGGYETNFIATHSNRFATYVSGAGNSDIIRSYYSYNYNFGKPFYFQFETGQYDMQTSVAEDKERYIKNSPILFVDKVNAPVLLWAGKKDENIAWDQVMEFYIGLRRYKKDVIAIFYKNQGHAFLNETPEEKDLSIKVLQWLDYFLKDRKNIHWIDKQIKRDAL
ncbi:prolyl oligopeptidase family serine peptidase [Chryseobacterium sp.]|uniref:alpha/beta hydrolase family protein n=1 Tax=Chryseobacterium sp. TaxID=1871047 RepID=UPI00333E9060